MIKLKTVKMTKYGGKCAKCQREIKKDWTLYFEPDTKKIYCVPCGKSMIASGEAKDTTVEKSEIPEVIDEAKEKEAIATSGKKPEEKLDFLQYVIAGIDSLRTQLDVQAGLIIKLTDSVNEMMNAFNKQLPPPEVKKTKKEK